MKRRYFASVISVILVLLLIGCSGISSSRGKDSPVSETSAAEESKEISQEPEVSVKTDSPEQSVKNSQVSESSSSKEISSSATQQESSKPINLESSSNKENSSNSNSSSAKEDSSSRKQDSSEVKQERSDLAQTESSNTNSSSKPSQEQSDERTESSEAVEESVESKPETESSMPTEEAEQTLPEDSTFEIYFIDVGEGDAALVLCDGEAMLIDGGMPSESQKIYAYLERLSVSHLKYIVCTHVHDDHIGGLAGALNYATVDIAFCPQDQYESEAFASFVNHLGNQGKNITVPKAGEQFTLGHALVQIVGPIQPSDNLNNTSIVLRIVYGDTSFLFTGDAEKDEEGTLLSSDYDLASTVLKVGHHGSDTSTTQAFLKKVSPSFAVISTGDNLYGHPTETVLNNLKETGAQLFRTDMQGEIYCTSDGTTVTFQVEKNADLDTLSQIGPYGFIPLEAEESAVEESEISETREAEAQAYDYVLNTNTHKFHYPDCKSVRNMKEENKMELHATREEIIAMGYQPCGNCHP